MWNQTQLEQRYSDWYKKCTNDGGSMFIVLLLGLLCSRLNIGTIKNQSNFFELLFGETKLEYSYRMHAGSRSMAAESILDIYSTKTGENSNQFGLCGLQAICLLCSCLDPKVNFISSSSRLSMPVCSSGFFPLWLYFLDKPVEPTTVRFGCGFLLCVLRTYRMGRQTDCPLYHADDAKFGHFYCVLLS